MGKKRNSIKIMFDLLLMVKSLLWIMFIAVIMGSIGHLIASFITILGAYMFCYKELNFLFIIVLFAFLRGIFRYIEQACNHYLAFKILAVIRHKVFKAIRRLAPAKIDTLEKGNFISILTSDVELLEVFYAHTISPILIAIITTTVMVLFLSNKHIYLGIIILIFHLIVGVVIPIYNRNLGKKVGVIYRENFGKLNNIVLENLYGLDEIKQYNYHKERYDKLYNQMDILKNDADMLKNNEWKQDNITNLVIWLSSTIMAYTSIYLYKNNLITFNDVVISIVTILSSFGPTIALSNLSNNLNHTLASGSRVLDLLEEKPIVNEIINGESFENGDINCKNVTFSYSDINVLNDINYEFKLNKINGIIGKSGSGKSTLLKILMRFYETKKGEILYNNTNVNDINTKELRENISYLRQETFLFKDTIENNIKIGKLNATREEVILAAKKASIHEFIISLKNGYDTKIEEYGVTLSEGEKQRIGLARAFLHDSSVIILDEPTSNIDSLNEGIVLKSLKEESEDKTLIIVSHRESTSNIIENRIKLK